MPNVILGDWNDTTPPAEAGSDLAHCAVDRTVNPPKFSVAVPRASTAKHGTIMYDASGSPTKYLGADGNWHDTSSIMTGVSSFNTRTGAVTLTAADLPDATTGAKGAIRLEPAGDVTKYLRGDGAWNAPPAGGAAFNPATQAQWFDDFIRGVSTNNQVGELGWGYVTNGGVYITYYNTSIGHPGQVQLQTGSTTYGYCNLFLPLGLGQDLSATAWTLETLVQVDGMSGGEYYSIGFGQSHNDWNGVSASLICFRMDKRINGNWQAVCRKAGVETIVDTGVAATAWSWHKLKLIGDGAGTITFYVGGVLKATINTNVPTVTNIIGPQFFVGYISANNILVVDYFWLKMTLAR